MLVALVGILLTFGNVDSGNSWQRLTSVDLSPDGRYAAIGGCCGQRRSYDYHGYDANVTYRIMLVDLNEPNASPRVLEESTQSTAGWVGYPGRVAAFSRDGKVLAYGLWSDRARLLNLQTFESSAAPIMDSMPVRSIAFSADANSLVLSGEDDIYLCALDTGKVQHRTKDDRGRHYSDLRAAKFSPDGRLLALGYAPDIDILDVPTLKSISPVPGLEASRFASLEFSPDGHELAVAGWEAVHFCSIKDWSIRTAPSPVGTQVMGLAYLPDGAAMAVAGPGGLVLMNVANGLPLGGPLCTTPTVSVAISRDGRLALSGDIDGKATLWDLKSRSPLRVFDVVHYPRGVSMWVPIAFLTAWLTVALFLYAKRRTESVELSG
jgi:WD40 repeat protein